MEDRKLKEIEHSKIRRDILKGFERSMDTFEEYSLNNKEGLILNKEEFDRNFSNMKYYSITRSSEAYKENWMKNNITSGSRVLDWACGNGENGLFAAGLGAQVTGIDISPEGVRNANQNAQDLGLDGNCEFQVMDGERMDFKSDTFDFAVEYGALHHVELDISLQELARVLKKSGRMLCVEAMRHNPIIHAYRKRTPHLRTEWEVDHILGVESHEIMRRYFNTVTVRYFHLCSLLLVPFRKQSFFKMAYPIFDKIDQIILKKQFLGKYGWIMIIELANPK